MDLVQTFGRHAISTGVRLFYRSASSTKPLFEPSARVQIGRAHRSLRYCILLPERDSAKSIVGATGLAKAIDAMAGSSTRADAAIARLVPALQHRCVAPAEPLWTKRLALTGLLTPFYSGDDPMPMEVLYDWSVPGQRSRVFPRQGDVTAHDFLLLQSGGYNVIYQSDGKVMCIPGLPGSLRPDWSQRAPCGCSAQIDAGTSLTPDEPIQILSCPLNAPRIAWAWYTRSGRPTLFMVTSNGNARANP